jgi:hypothetical protein
MYLCGSVSKIPEPVEFVPGVTTNSYGGTQSLSAADKETSNDKFVRTKAAKRGATQFMDSDDVHMDTAPSLGKRAKRTWL